MRPFLEGISRNKTSVYVGYHRRGHGAQSDAVRAPFSQIDARIMNAVVVGLNLNTSIHASTHLTQILIPVEWLGATCLLFGSSR